MKNVELKKPLTNMQVELLNLFTHDIDNEDLKELKRLIVKYLAKKTTKLADDIWVQNNWQKKDMDFLLHNHERTAYKPE